MEQYFETLTDEELLQEHKNGNDKIMEFLCNKYKPLVLKKAKSMFILGADAEDLIQEGMIGLFKAVRDYDSGRDASFYTFADLCISRQIYTAVSNSKRKKHAPLNDYVSLSAGNGDWQEENNSILEMISDSLGDNPEKQVLHRERMEYLLSRIHEELSDFERQIFELRMTGMSTGDIAKVLGKDAKATDNGFQRVRSKIKKLIIS